MQDLASGAQANPHAPQEGVAAAPVDETVPAAPTAVSPPPAPQPSVDALSNPNTPPEKGLYSPFMAPPAAVPVPAARVEAPTEQDPSQVIVEAPSPPSPLRDRPMLETPKEEVGAMPVPVGEVAETPTDQKISIEQPVTRLTSKDIQEISLQQQPTPEPQPVPPEPLVRPESESPVVSQPETVTQKLDIAPEIQAQQTALTAKQGKLSEPFPESSAMTDEEETIGRVEPARDHNGTGEALEAVVSSNLSKK